MHIFADESCLGNQFRENRNPGGAAGLVERFDPRAGWVRKDFCAYDPDTTNNRMAILSGILGLSYLRRPCRVVFTSDSQYLVCGMKEWIHDWSRRGWRRRGGEVENVDLWRRLARAASRHDVEWSWVRGHADHPKNEYANMLAVRTAKSGASWEGLVESGFDEWIQVRIDAGRFTDFLDLPLETFTPDPAPPAT